MQLLNVKLTAHQLITLDLLLCAKRRELQDLRAEYANSGNDPEGLRPYENRIKDINATREAINHALNGGE